MAYNGVIGTTNKRVVSAVASLDERTIMKKVVDATGEANFVKNIMAIGRFVPTTTHQYTHFQHEDLGIVGDATGGTIVGSGTATLTIPLTAGTSGYFRVGDQVKLTGDDKNGFVSAITRGASDTLTVKSLSGTITFANTNKVIWAGRMDVEGGDSAENIIRLPTSNFNQLAIATESDVITDIQYHSQITVVGSDGEPYIQGLHHDRKVMNMLKAMSVGLISSQISTETFGTSSSSLVIGGKNAQSSRGFDQYIKQEGAESNVATDGTFVEADLDSLNAAWQSRKIPSRVMALGNSLASVPMKKYLKNLNSSGVTSGRMNIDGREVDLEVEKFFTTAGYEVNFMHDAVFNDPTTLAASTNAISKNLYFVPMDNVAVSGGTAPRISVRYFDPKTENVSGANVTWKDIIKETYSGALAPNPTGTVRELRTDWVAYYGLEIIGARQTLWAKMLA